MNFFTLRTEIKHKGFKMTNTTITFTKEQIETLCLVCSFYRSAMDKHSFAESNIDKVKKLQVFLIKERRKFEGN